MINTLLGAAIGLLATTAILPGTERGLVIERTRIALERNAAFLRAIGHDRARQRLAARRAARAANDDLVAVIDRAIGVLTSSERASASEHTTAFEQPMPYGLAESLQSVHTAAVHLGQTASQT